MRSRFFIRVSPTIVHRNPTVTERAFNKASNLKAKRISLRFRHALGIYEKPTPTAKIRGTRRLTVLPYLFTPSGIFLLLTVSQ